jgi:hypothetical protein
MTRNGWSPVLVQRYRTWNEDRPSSTVVLSKKQHNRFLQSFWERCRWSKDWNTAVTFTSRYVLVSEWRERLFRKHHGEGDKAARSVKYFVETAFFVSFWNFVTIFLMKMSCDVGWRHEKRFFMTSAIGWRHEKRFFMTSAIGWRHEKRFF